MQTGCTLHLFQSFDRHHSRKRLSFPLDDKLIMAQRNAIEDITELLPNF